MSTHEQEAELIALRGIAAMVRDLLWCEENDTKRFQVALDSLRDYFQQNAGQISFDAGRPGKAD